MWENTVGNDALRTQEVGCRENFSGEKCPGEGEFPEDFPKITMNLKERVYIGIY